MRHIIILVKFFFFFKGNFLLSILLKTSNFITWIFLSGGKPVLEHAFCLQILWKPCYFLKLLNGLSH
jgi:hypothetical protein